MLIQAVMDARLCVAGQRVQGLIVRVGKASEDSVQAQASSYLKGLFQGKPRRDS
ncbi:hypothetical protein BSFA1_80720 (plasmid) [Burkholderia sp. SFA1]|nr:hypothetical protein BSFA1_80720 [Burkholderia sp. SFA1]